MRARYPSFTWIARLPDHFALAGFEIRHASTENIPPAWLRYAYDENVLCAMLEFADSIADEARREEFGRWVAQAYGECQQSGFTHDWAAVCVVGRKLSGGG